MTVVYEQQSIRLSRTKACENRQIGVHPPAQEVEFPKIEGCTILK